MILIVAIIFGLAATYMRARLKCRKITLKHLRWEWLVFVTVIPQVLVFQVPSIGRWVPEALIPGIQIISMAGLVVFCAANILEPGFWALILGLCSNFLVILLNGGWMPISPDTLKLLAPAKPIEAWMLRTRLGFSKDMILSINETNLSWLSDRFILPPWVPYKVAFSLGDIFISIGAFLLLWSLSSKQEEVL
jgi:hypothetical protein